MPYYTIYTVTNRVNGMVYHGKHITDDPMDEYIGTGGAHYKNAIKKYGRENFIKSIRMLCRSEEIMTEMEEHLSYMEDWPNDQNCYNENYGGNGSWHHVHASGIMLGDVNPSKRPEVRQKLCRSHTPERKANHIERMKGTSYRFGIPHNESTKQHVSARLKGKPKEIVECPHCRKSGGKPVMKRYHFDNCKVQLSC